MGTLETCAISSCLVHIFQKTRGSPGSRGALAIQRPQRRTFQKSGFEHLLPVPLSSACTSFETSVTCPPHACILMTPFPACLTQASQRNCSVQCTRFSTSACLASLPSSAEASYAMVSTPWMLSSSDGALSSVEGCPSEPQMHQTCVYYIFLYISNLYTRYRN